MKTIGFDVTGGDLGEKKLLKIINEIGLKYKNINFLVYTTNKIENTNNIFYKNVSEIIEVNEDPMLAIRRKKDSAIVIGCNDLVNEESDAFISLGSTGALVTAGTIIVKRLPDIKRPVLPVFLSNEKTKKVRMFLDVGATVDIDAQDLVNNAKLAVEYMKNEYNINNPSIRLLNIGIEENKGTKVYKEAYQLLKEDIELNFLGNIEGYDLLTGENDITIMGGFEGNIVLKTLEGSMEFFKENLKTMFTKNIFKKIFAIFFQKDLKDLKEKVNPHKNPCTPILGIRKKIIKIHGGASEEQVFNALEKVIKEIMES